MLARNTSEHSSRQLSGCSETERWQPGAFKKTPEVSGPLAQERMDLFKALISTLSSWSSVLLLSLFLGCGSKVPWSPLTWGSVPRTNWKVVGHFRNQMRPCEDLPPGLPRELVLTGALAKGLPAWYRSCSHSDETSFRMASSSSVDAEEVLQDRGPPEKGSRS